MKINVEIKGVAPMLQHRFDETIGTKKKKMVYDSKEDAERAAYKNGKGYYTPNTHIKTAMVKASTDFVYKGKKTYKDYIKSGVFIEPMELTLTPQKYSINKMAVVINRSRIIRCRPQFDNWSLKFIIDIIDENLDKTVIKEILEAAGKYKGIGDNRPEYGRFKITKFKEKNA